MGQWYSKVHFIIVQLKRYILEKKGIRGLYAGTTPVFVKNIAENSVLFGFYGVYQKYVLKFTNQKVISNL